MPAETAAELQIIIRAQIEEAQAALQSVSDTATKMNDALTSAGTDASGALSRLQGSATDADTALSSVAESAQKAADTMDTSLAEATKPLEDVAVAADTAKTSLSTLSEGTTAPLQELETVAAELTGELQKTAAAAEEAVTGLHDAGAAAEEAASEERSFAGSMREAKEGIEATHLAMTAFMGIAFGGMIAEWTERAEKLAISLDKLQAMTHTSSEQTNQLALMAAGSGVGMDALSTMIGKMDKQVTNATAGTSTLSKLLSQLGVNAAAFGQAAPQQQAEMLAKALDDAHMPTKKLDAALKSLNVTSSDFASQSFSGKVQALADGLNTTTDSATSLGRVLSQAGINAEVFMHASSPDQIQIVAGAYKRLSENANTVAQANGLVTTVFGRQGQAMIPLLQNYNDLNEFAKKLHMPAMNTEDLTLAAERTKMLQFFLTELSDSILSKLLPIIDGLALGFTQLATNIMHPITAIRDFVTDLGPVGAAITSVVVAFAGMKVVNAIASTVGAFTESMKAASIAMGIFKVAEEEGEAAGLKFAAVQNLQAAASKVATIAGAAFDAVMDANPIAIVTLAITALIGIIVLLATHWKQVTDWIQQHWGINVPQIMQRLRQVFTDVWNAIKLVLQVVWDYFKLVFEVDLLVIRTVWETAWDAVKLVFKLTFDAITGVLKVAWDIIRGLFQVELDLITGHWGKAWNDMKSLLSTVWNDIKKMFENFGQDAAQFGENFVRMIGQGIMRGIHFVEDAAKNVVSKIKSFLGFGSPTEDGPGATSDQWAPNFINMYAQGLTEGAAKIQAAVEHVMKPVSTAFAGVGVSTSTTQSVTHGWPASAIPTMAGGGLTQVVIQVSGNVTRNEQELAERIASEFQRKMKLRTQLS